MREETQNQDVAVSAPIGARDARLPFGRARLIGLAVGVAACGSAFARPPNLGLLGYNELAARVGAENVPTGVGVGVAQIEATSVAGQNAYVPDPAFTPFAAVVFTEHTLPWAVSAHATNVGQHIYGVGAPAPGVVDVHCWLADDWLTDGGLHVSGGSGMPPDEPPQGVRVINNSWVGTFGSASLDNEAMRRADALVEREDVLLVSAIGTGSNLMLGNGYNGLTVSTATQNPIGYLTPATLDGPGRTKPDIVAPVSSRSAATGIVSGVAAALFETAQGLSDGGEADRPETLKACLMAGAARGKAWSNGAPTSGESRGVATRPLDPTQGAGTVNIDRAHLILTGGRREGTSSPAGQTPLPRAAWDSSALLSGASRFYRFKTTGEADEVSVVAVWERRVAGNFWSFTSANFDLELWRLSASGASESMVGPAGAAVFDGGNVVSRSAADNVEHVRVTGLAPGDYALEVRRADTLGGSAWEFTVAWLWPEQECPGDANGDNLVNFTDLNIVLSHYGQAGTPGSLPGDVDGNGVVNFLDLNIVLSFFGRAC